MLGRDEWLERVASIRQYQKGGERAPHKPLLLLYSLGRLHNVGRSKVAYADAEAPLLELLESFGPPRPTTPAYPFRRLANDEGLWTLETATGELPTDSAGNLKELQTSGRLDPEFEAALLDDPGMLASVARYLLDDNWPESLHADIADAVGLDLDGLEADLARSRLAADKEEVSRRKRDPRFRERVLVAYERQCAFCGYDGRLDSSTIGLDAAHIRWHGFDGTDTVDNAVCLCVFHHRLLDRGAMGIAPELTVQVSAHFVGRGDVAARLVLERAGAPLLGPQLGEPAPSEDNVEWHLREVFREPARQA
ncbi:MAG: restriction endonuclease [Actinobacteria bacterium]|nr:MAG: restriction endonuclease [Actinomycetota bacterium]RIK04562.1 MAG: restriction endonuclease [Acidobacteriota bacterium]